MRTTKQILPGLKFIGWVKCEDLVPDVALRGITEMTVPILADIHEVYFFDNPQCECVTQNDGGSRTDTATLKFLSSTLLPRHEHIAFVVTAVDGNSYIIGAREAPFPKLKTSIIFGVPGDEEGGFYYEIAYSAIKSLVKCSF